MKRFALIAGAAAAALLAVSLAANRASSQQAPAIGVSQNGAPLGLAHTFNCTGALECSIPDGGGVANLNAGGSDGGLLAHKVLSSTHSDSVPDAGATPGDLLVVDNSGKWTRLPKDNPNTALVILDGGPEWELIPDPALQDGYSGTGSCTTNQFVIGLSRAAVPTCAQPTIANLAAMSSNTLMSGGAGTGNTALVMPGTCINNTDALLWNPTTHAFQCSSSIVAYRSAQMNTAGTTTTVLHGNADPLYAPAYGAVVDADITPAYSGTGACAADTWATTLSRAAAPTCAAITDLGLPATISASRVLQDSAFVVNGTYQLGYQGTNTVTGNLCQSGANDLCQGGASIHGHTHQNASGAGGTLSAAAIASGNLGLAYGGTANNITATEGAILYSTSSTLALNAAGTSGQGLYSAGTGAPTWADTTKAVRLAADYSNATTGLTDVLSFGTVGTGKVAGYDCTLTVDTSTTAIGAQFAATSGGTVTATAFQLLYFTDGTTAAWAHGTTAGSAIGGTTSAGTTQTVYRFGGVHQENLSGTVRVQAKASAAGTIYVRKGSFCLYWVY